MAAAEDLDGSGPARAELLERVLAMQGAGGSPARRSTGVAVPEACPFMGPAPFGVGDAAHFFGRERLVADLAARLIRGRFVAIVGASGSGKTSLLEAGLLAALDAGLLPGSAEWHQVRIRPGERPMARLHGALGLAADRPVQDALAGLGGGERLLVAVDQLEEVFSVCGSARERGDFLTALAALATDPQGRAVVVVAVRADALGRFADDTPLAGLLAANQVPVVPMLASQLRRAVELPAARAGLKVEPDLVDALVDDVAGEPGGLPLLSTALADLWRRRTDSTVTLAAYRASGAIAGAAATLAEGAYLGISDDRRPLVRTIMLRLVAQDAGAAVPRAAASAEFDLQHNPDAASILAELAAGRVVTLSEGTVELAHRGLLREWPRLRDWIEVDTQARAQRARLAEAAALWDAGGRDPADLERGTRLAAALEYSADHELSPLERDYLADSRAAAEAHDRLVHLGRRRLGGLLAGMAVLLAVALVAGMLALQQGERADQAETARLAHSLGAQALVERQLDLSLLLARQAVALQDTPQTRGRLLDVLLRHPAALATMRTNSEPGTRPALAIAPDGATLAIADPGAGLFFFDARTFRPIGERVDIPFIHTLAFSPDGRTLAYAAARPGVDQIGLVDAGTHERLATAAAGNPSRIAFLPDGSRLVAIDTEQAGPDRVRRWLSLWDAQSLTRIYRPTPGLGFVEDESGDGERDPALTDDGGSLLTHSHGDLTLWDVQSQQALWTLHTDSEPFNTLAVSPDKGTVAVGLDDGIRLIDVATSLTRVVAMIPGSNPTHLVFSPDGATLAATNSDGTVSLWNTASPTRPTVLDARSQPVGPAAFATDGRAVFSPDGLTVYTPGSDGMAVAWDVAGNRGVPARFTFTAGGERGRLPGRFSPDGRLIAVARAGDGIGIWDADALTPSGQPLLSTGGQVKDLAFSGDGRRLAAVTAARLTIWDLESRSLLQTRGTAAWASGPIAVSVSPDGATAAVASQRGVQLFDVAAGSEAGNLLGAQQWSGSVAFSPVGPMVAFTAFTVWPGDNGRVQVMDLDQGSLLAELDLPTDAVQAVVLSQDGRRLAASYADPLVQIWDVDTWQPVRQIRPAGSSVAAMDLSPDGSVLAVADQHDQAELWDVASGSPLGVTLEGEGGWPTLDFSPDGHRLLATSASGTATVWEVDPHFWAERACAVANRALTPQEWEEYLPDRPYAPACTG